MTTVFRQRYEDVINKTTGISDFTVDSVIKSKLTQAGNKLNDAGIWKGLKGHGAYNHCLSQNYLFTSKELTDRYDEIIGFIDNNGFTLGNYFSKLKIPCLDSKVSLTIDSINSRIGRGKASFLGIDKNTGINDRFNVRDYFRLNISFFPEKTIRKDSPIKKEIISISKPKETIQTIQEKTMTTITEKQNEVLEKEILIDDNIIDSSVMVIGVLVFGIMGYLLYSSRGKL